MTNPLADTFQTQSARNCVLVVDGYGVHLAVQSGHLTVQDGVGRHRRTRRFAKVGHHLTRLVVIGHSGTVTLEALRWLDRVGIHFNHLDTDGTIITASANAAVDDPRLRRTQALAAATPAGHRIVARLLTAKLNGQATVASAHLDAPGTAEHIAALTDRLNQAVDFNQLRELEAAAAAAYFNAWTGNLTIRWAIKDRPHVPDHWTRFDGRRSLLSNGSSRQAADPINATLNYLYALAETECRRACLKLGLDPGLGLLHADANHRDSLALDLIEPIRPTIDTYLLDLLNTHTFKRNDFTERPNGHCRILAPLTHQLAQTLPDWAHAVAPHAETVAHALADASTAQINKRTPLTSRQRRTTAYTAAQPRRKAPNTDNPSTQCAAPGNRPIPPACVDCGATLTTRQRTYCPDCWPAQREANRDAASEASHQALAATGARQARGAAISRGKTDALARHARTHGWEPADWRQNLAPRIRYLTLAQITTATGLSQTHASRIKRGAQTPHPRHWTALHAAATLAGADTICSGV